MEKSANELLQKYLKGTCTEEECALVERFYLDQLEESEWGQFSENASPKDAIWSNIRSVLRHPIQKHTPHTSIGKRKRTLYITAAAAVLACTLVVGYWLYDTVMRREGARAVAADVQPGGNKAMLTLSDGRTIDLSAQQSTVIMGNAITYTDGSTVLDNETASMGQLELSTPKGGQYQVILPDGTHVWLNAASTLKYPSKFDEMARVVELDGEAYFEVTSVAELNRSGQKRNGAPFIVKTAQQEVKVLGTHFNINAYSDEPHVKTTLLEGAVEVSLPNTLYKEYLRPGQQSIVHGKDIQIQEVDMDYAVAWKQGDFIFQDEAIESIMRKLERWYDIEVVYSGKPSQAPIGAKISRDRSLMKVLTLLESTGVVHFKLEGRRVTVMP